MSRDGTVFFAFGAELINIGSQIIDLGSQLITFCVPYQIFGDF